MSPVRARVAMLVAFPVLAVLTSCGESGTPLRFRHETKRRLTYEVALHEEAPHPVAGLGGSLDTSETFTLSCISVDPDGAGHYEIAVGAVKLTAPPSAGAEVDTALGRPVEGDKIGLTAVAQSLLPRTAIVVLGPNGAVAGAQSDDEIAKHLSEFMKTKPVASRKAIFRIAEMLDAGPVAHRWWNPVAALFPANERTAPGSKWTASPPVVETPAGRLVPKIDVTYTREGDVAVLTGKGTFSPEGTLPEKRALDLDAATLDMTARIDLARGVLVSYDETGRFEFRLRGEGKLPAPWATTRKLKLVKDEVAK